MLVERPEERIQHGDDLLREGLARGVGRLRVTGAADRAVLDEHVQTREGVWRLVPDRLLAGLPLQGVLEVGVLRYR
jgi:hypothetical protein